MTTGHPAWWASPYQGYALQPLTGPWLLYSHVLQAVGSRQHEPRVDQRATTEVAPRGPAQLQGCHIRPRMGLSLMSTHDLGGLDCS